MLRYEIKIDNEIEVYAKEEALGLLKEMVEVEIETEREYLEDEDLGETSERLEGLLEIDTDWIYDLEENGELLIDRSVEIREFNYYIRELLDENGYVYDRSTMSKSIYVENNEGKLIRISDHNTPSFSSDYGHRIPDIELIYSDEEVSNEDLEKYFNIRVEGTILL